MDNVSHCRVQVWLEIARNTKRTGGKVFVLHRTDGQGSYGCDFLGPGSLDGAAQEGEVAIAMEFECEIEWVGYSCAVAEGIPPTMASSTTNCDNV